MIHKKNIILTGELHCGKSTLVRNVLGKVSMDYRGIFVESIIEREKTIGYGLRLVGRSDLLVFAHNDISGPHRFGPYGIDLAPFDHAVRYIENLFLEKLRLFVVDEIGIIEEKVRPYSEAINMVLDSATPSLLVVQNRSGILKEIKKRNDVNIFELANNHIALEQEILILCKNGYQRQYLY